MRPDGGALIQRSVIAASPAAYDATIGNQLALQQA